MLQNFKIRLIYDELIKKSFDGGASIYCIKAIDFCYKICSFILIPNVEKYTVNKPQQ